MVLEEPQETVEFGIYPVLQMRYLKHMGWINHSFSFLLSISYMPDAILCTGNTA